MEEQEQYKQLEEWMIDERIESVKNRNKEIERLKEIAEKRKEQIDLKTNSDIEKLQKQNEYDLTTIRQWVLESENKQETKTQYKLKFPSGDTVIKKPSQSVKKPSKKQFEELFKAYPEFKKKKEDYDLNWKDLKSRLKIINDKIIDAETGEDVTNLFEVDVKDEEVIIK